MSVGVDLGQTSIKIVELESRGKGRIKALGIIPVSVKSPLEAKDESELAALSKELARLKKEARISEKEITIALPTKKVYTGTIKFPALTDQEISSAVKWESEQHIPIPITEAVVQHQIIERTKGAGKEETLVLLVAAPKVLIENYIAVCNMAGFEVAAVETEMLSLVRALASKDTTSLIIDFSNLSTDIGISRRGKLVFSRSIPVGGQMFTRSIVQSLGVDYQQAEEYKKTYGLEKQKLEGKIAAVLSPSLASVADEIKKAIYYYQSEEKGEVPTSAILTGATAGMPGLAQAINGMLAMEAVVGNPFGGLEVPQEVAKNVANYYPHYSVAVGLALRSE